MLHGDLVQQKVLHDGSLQKVMVPVCCTVCCLQGMIIQLQVLRVGKTLNRLSHQLKGDQEALGNPGSTGAVPPALPLRCYNASVSASAEAAAPSGGFACAVAALAEQQHMLGDSSSAATCQTSRYDVLSRSERSFTEDLSVAGSSSSGTRVEEPSNSRT